MKTISVSILAGALLAACAQIPPPATLPSSSATDRQAFCNRLQQVIDAADKGFEPIKGKFHSSAWMRIWQTEAQFEGGNCQVWGWGSGKTGYTCSWEDRNQDTARRRFLVLEQQVKDCLAAKWTQHSEQPTARMHGVWFGRPDRHYQVAVSQIDDSGALLRRWRTYLFVGDPEAALYKQKKPAPPR